MVSELKKLAKWILPVKALRALRPQQIKSQFEHFLHASYYKYFFGKNGPVAAALGDKIARWERRKGRGDIPVPEAQWDSEYAAGDWDYLSDLEQAARFSVIAGHIQVLKPGASILDVGCGKGTLRERLN